MMMTTDDDDEYIYNFGWSTGQKYDGSMIMKGFKISHFFVHTSAITTG